MEQSQNKTIIAIAGPIGAGKTTLAKELQLNLKSSHIFSFSTPLKEIARQMGWNGMKDKRGRKLLQMIGTELGRDLIGPYIWVRKLHASIQESPYEYAIIDDLRFENEARYIMNQGGIIVRIDTKKSIKTFLGLRHRSEKPIPKELCDVIIKNDYPTVRNFLHEARDKTLLTLNFKGVAR